MSGFIERSEWKNFLGEFSKRNQLRPTHLEVIGEVGAQEAEVFLPFVGVDFESKGSMKGSVASTASRTAWGSKTGME